MGLDGMDRVSRCLTGSGYAKVTPLVRGRASRRPSEPVERSHAHADNRDALGDKEGPLQRFATPIAAKAPAGGDHTVIRDVGALRRPHHVADSAGRAGISSESRDVAV